MWEVGQGHPITVCARMMCQGHFYARFDTRGFHCCRKMHYSMLVIGARKVGKSHLFTGHA